MTDDEDTVETQRRILRSLWSPHPGQQAIMAHSARFRVAVCGRRWGKSEMAAHLALEYALGDPGSTVWWVAPSYQQANDYGFDNIRPLLTPDILADEPTLSKPRDITLTNGSTLTFRSAERQDSLRGGGVDFLVIDEAGSVPDRAWVEELRPTLSDTEGDMLAIGTPIHRNWFYQWFRRGQSDDHPEVASWQAPTEQNPHVPNDEIEKASGDMPDREFRREYLAQFLDESGGVFVDLEKRALAEYDPAEVDGEPPYSTGVDFARSDDYTVILTLDGTGRLVHFDRLQAGWPEIQRRVTRTAEQYAGPVLLDATRDNKIVADLEAAGVRVTPVLFTSRSKRELIENLVTAVESAELTLPDMDPLVHELEVFERTTTNAGNVSYSAPSGFRDDCADALALAVRGMTDASREAASAVARLQGNDDSASDGKGINLNEVAREMGRQSANRSKNPWK
jgi:hypothetical protein